MKKQLVLELEHHPMLGVTEKKPKGNENEAPYDWVCEKCGLRYYYGSLKKKDVPS